MSESSPPPAVKTDVFARGVWSLAIFPFLAAFQAGINAGHEHPARAAAWGIGALLLLALAIDELKIHFRSVEPQRPGLLWDMRRQSSSGVAFFALLFCNCIPARDSADRHELWFYGTALIFCWQPRRS